MNAGRLLEFYEQISEAPNAIARLRRFVLDLAVRGKLVEQDPAEKPASELLIEIAADKELRAISAKDKKAGKISAIDVRDSPNLPRSWLWARFGDLTISRDGERKPVSKTERAERAKKYDYYGASGVIDKIDGYLFDKPLLLIGEDGANLINRSTPIAFIARGQYWVNNHAHVLDGINEQFLRYLELFINATDLKPFVTGTAQPKMNQAKMNSIPVAVPPLAEQHRIVAKVDELMALCDRLEEARKTREKTRDKLTAATLARLTAPEAPVASETEGTNAPSGAAPNQAEPENAGTGPLSGTATAQPSDFPTHARFAIETLPALTSRPDQIKSLRQTILNLAVLGKLVEQDPADEPASTLVEELSLERVRLMKAGKIPKKPEPSRDPKRGTADLPSNWKWIAFGGICNLVTSGSRGWGQYYSESGPFFVRAQNIRFGELALDQLAHVQPPTKSEGSRTQVFVGDLLLVITGAGVTTPAVLEKDLGEAYVSQHVGLVRLTDTSLSPWVLLCLMAQEGGRGELVDRAYGAGRPGLNLENIRALSVPIPPLAEQHRIVAKVDTLMALCDRLEAALTTADTTRTRLLEALLHDALKPAEKTLEAAE